MLRSRHAILRWVRFALAVWVLGIAVGVVNGCIGVTGGHQSAAAAAYHPNGVTDDDAHARAKSASCTTLCQKSTVGAPETRFDDGGTAATVHPALVDARRVLGAVSDRSRTALQHRPHSLRGSPLLRIAYKRFAL